MITKPQRSALLWLINRNGTGIFDKNGVLVAGGERAPIMRSSWNALVKAGAIEFAKDRKRLTVTDSGYAVDLNGISENLSYGAMA